MENNKPIAIDFFAGAGGVTTGLKQAGFQVTHAIDVDGRALEVLKTNHPEVQTLAIDIMPGGEEALKVLPRGATLVHGSPPCQPFSTQWAGGGDKKNLDQRRSLGIAFAELAVTLSPAYVTIEEVPPFLGSDEAQEIKKILRNAGYHLREEILNAWHYDTPQVRRRYFLVAARDGLPPMPAPGASRLTVRDAIGGLPPPRESADPDQRRHPQPGEKVQKMIRHVPKNGGAFKDLPDELIPEWWKTRENSYNWRALTRAAWDRPARTVIGQTDYTAGDAIHPAQDRFLTVRERALLQGFPPDYDFSGAPLMRAYKYVGNAVPPPVMRAIGEAILATERSRRRHGKQ